LDKVYPLSQINDATNNNELSDNYALDNRMAPDNKIASAKKHLGFPLKSNHTGDGILSTPFSSGSAMKSEDVEGPNSRLLLQNKV